MMDPCKEKFSSLLTWVRVCNLFSPYNILQVNSFDIDGKIDNLSQLSDGVVLAQCLKLL